MFGLSRECHGICTVLCTPYARLQHTFIPRIWVVIVVVLVVVVAVVVIGIVC